MEDYQIESECHTGEVTSSCMPGDQPACHVDSLDGSLMHCQAVVDALLAYAGIDKKSLGDVIEMVLARS